MGSLILMWRNLPSTKCIWTERHINLPLHLFHFLEQVYIQTWNITETNIYDLKYHQSQNSQATLNKPKNHSLQLCVRTRYLILNVLISGMHWKHTSRAQIWNNDFMKKYMRFSYWLGTDCFRTDEHRGHLEFENRLKIKYSTNSDKYTWTSAYMDSWRAIAEQIP